MARVHPEHVFMCICSPLQVFKQHNPETGVVEEKAVSSRDELPAEGTPGVEVDWDHSRAKGQLLAETFAAEDELWVDCNKCCVQVACKLDPSKNSGKWDFYLRRQVTAMPCWCGYVAQGIGSGICLFAQQHITVSWKAAAAE